MGLEFSRMELGCRDRKSLPNRLLNNESVLGRDEARDPRDSSLLAPPSVTRGFHPHGHKVAAAPPGITVHSRAKKGYNAEGQLRLFL